MGSLYHPCLPTGRFYVKLEAMKSLFKTLLAILFFISFALLFPSPTQALDCTDGINTGLGCIPAKPGELAKWLLGKAILMGGGIAFLLSLFGGITIILAAGDPEKINQGKQIIGSAISGILFIILSVLLLRLIGVDILQLPGFS
jgi:hypothetical protein